MWERQPLATLRASTACIGITLLFFYGEQNNILFLLEWGNDFSVVVPVICSIYQFLNFFKNLSVSATCTDHRELLDFMTLIIFDVHYK
jgi:hypothetical protein